jgi:hypothetical protein
VQSQKTSLLEQFSYLLPESVSIADFSKSTTEIEFSHLIESPLSVAYSYFTAEDLTQTKKPTGAFVINKAWNANQRVKSSHPKVDVRPLLLFFSSSLLLLLSLCFSCLISFPFFFFALLRRVFLVP